MAMFVQLLNYHGKQIAKSDDLYFLVMYFETLISCIVLRVQ